MKIALVHDYLLNYGGAERVLFALHRMYPDADIFTLLYDEKLKDLFPKKNIKTSFLNDLPTFFKKRHKFLLPLFPVAIESFDLSGYDMVISSSSVFAKGIVTNPGTTHICYCHSPARFLWDYNERYLKDEKNNTIVKPLIKFLLHKTRIWDRSSAERVDFWIANSEVTKKRIKKYYKKDAKVIYPPVDTIKASDNFLPEEKDYFLVVSRLSPYKKIDIIIEAFNKLEIPLVIIGEGRDEKRLRSISKKNIYFKGFLPDDKLGVYLKKCKAFVMAQEEDFGIAPIEAMSFGKPILAYKKGGAEEWLEEGVTGEFFESQTPEVLADGIRRLQENIKKYDSSYIRKKANQFNLDRFKKEFFEFVKSSENNNLD